MKQWREESVGRSSVTEEEGRLVSHTLDSGSDKGDQELTEMIPVLKAVDAKADIVNLPLRPPLPGLS